MLQFEINLKLYLSKVKDKPVFDDWVKRLRNHRLYRQHEIAYGHSFSKQRRDLLSPTEETPILTSESTLD